MLFLSQVICLVLLLKCHLDVRIDTYDVFLKRFSLHIFSGDELKQTVSIVVDIASVLDPDGVDVYFLNREPVFHVHNSSELAPIFAVPPAGVYTY